MELHLTVFFALTFLTLAGNAFVLWWIWKVLRRVSERREVNRRRYNALKITVRRSLKGIESGTSELAVRSGDIRNAVIRLEGGLDRADNWARYGLAKVDFNADRVANRLGSKTKRLAGEIRGPLYKTAAAIHGVKAVLELIARWKQPRPESGSRLARALPPLETAATIIDAVTALGELFGPRHEPGDIDPTTAKPFR